MSLECEVRDIEVLESAFEKHRQNINVDNGRLACEAAREEWDNVTTVETVFRNSFEFQHSLLPHITVHQALAYFQGHDLSVDSVNERGSVERWGLCTLLSCLLGPPELHDHLTAERDLVFAIAQRELDMSEPVHVRMLQTVYQRLTGTRLHCPNYGSHWEHIGFQESRLHTPVKHPLISDFGLSWMSTKPVEFQQGTDPGTDLRGVGMLGLLQLLYLSNTPHLIPLARDIYRVSMDDQQNFPLAVMSLNMTRIALQALRHGELNRECNHQQLVLQVVNQFYVAVFHHTLHIWTSQHKTIRDSGFVLKDVELYCRGNVRAVLRELQEQLASYTSSHSYDKPCLPGSFQDLLSQAKTEVFI